MLVLALATGVMALEAPVLPWKLFSEQAKDGVGVNMTSCKAGQEVLIARFETKTDAYATFYGVESQMYVLLYFKGNIAGAQADAVGVGKVNMDQHDSIPELKWMSVEQAKLLYPTMCSVLFPETV